MIKYLKLYSFLFCLIMLNSCATSGTAFLGPIFTGAKTGSIYQASLSYSTGKILNEFNPYIDSNITKKKNNLKNNDLLKEFPYVDKNPLILKSYKIDLVEFSELIEPEPLP